MPGQKVARQDPFSDVSLFRALMESTADSIYFKDRDCRLVRVNKGMANSLSVSDPAELVGKSDIDLYGEEFGQGTRVDDLRVMESGRPIIGLLESRKLANGRTNWSLASKLPIRDESGQIVGLVGITREINELRQVEQALQHLATHDPLTGLPNRFLMVDRMSQLLARGRRSGAGFAVIFMDIDRFKDVNDAHGHEFGDLLLRAVADRLSTSVRQSDTVARIGGDEFVVIVDSMGAGEAETVASNIQRTLAASFAVQRHRVHVAVSIGVSTYPDNGTDADALLRAADYAMYMAKRAGGNRHATCIPGSPKPGEVLQRP